jgi:hypothetical protein
MTSDPVAPGAGFQEMTAVESPGASRVSWTPSSTIMVPAQPPAMHVSAPSHALPSSQAVPSGAGAPNVHVEVPLHVRVMQASLLHMTGVPLHVPATQMSP